MSIAPEILIAACDSNCNIEETLSDLFRDRLQVDPSSTHGSLRWRVEYHVTADLTPNIYGTGSAAGSEYTHEIDLAFYPVPYMGAPSPDVAFRRRVLFEVFDALVGETKLSIAVLWNSEIILARRTCGANSPEYPVDLDAYFRRWE